MLCYYGVNQKYIEQLKYLQPHIEKAFPGIIFHLSFNDQYGGDVLRSQLNREKEAEYAYVRTLRESHTPNEDIILNFLKESDLCYLT